MTKLKTNTFTKLFINSLCNHSRQQLNSCSKHLQREEYISLCYFLIYGYPPHRFLHYYYKLVKLKLGYFTRFIINYLKISSQALMEVSQLRGMTALSTLALRRVLTGAVVSSSRQNFVALSSEAVITRVSVRDGDRLTPVTSQLNT